MDSAQRYMDTILCENNISYSMSSMWVESEKYIYMTDSTGNSDEISSLFQVDVKGKEFEKCFSLKHPAKKVTSACLLENMILIHAKENERYSVYILDFNGNLVCDKETTVADLREGAEGNILCGGDMEYLYYEKWYDQGSCIIQIPVQGEGGNILWESKE